ncbi:hypothetical protein PROVRUST_08284 [Providencia rustigianii DSM 4541]|uniref:Uncharacterized protein n=1 Tax=Providencia rustigianii DSM 4541 TaxID=500637 RepID=D1P7R2_9GAMM|nr:hypothetical protein PROVRUST_08284 [Providencia rustigianii DSM 4541]
MDISGSIQKYVTRVAESNQHPYNANYDEVGGKRWISRGAYKSM